MSWLVTGSIVVLAICVVLGVAFAIDSYRRRSR